VSASRDTTARVWDLETGECSLVLKGHKNGIPSVAWSADGAFIATVSSDGTLGIWDPGTGERTAMLRVPGGLPTSVVVAPTGSWVGAGTIDGVIQVFDRKTGNPITSFRGHDGRIGDLLATADGDRLVSCSFDRTVRVWDCATWKSMAVLRGHRREVEGLALTDGGGTLLSASPDQTVRRWYVDLDPRLTGFDGHREPVVRMTTNADGTLLVAGTFVDGKVRTWDTVSGACLRAIPAHERGLTCLALLPDGRRLLTGGNDHFARLWDLGTGDRLAEMSHSGSVKSVFTVPDSEALVTLDAWGHVSFWDAEGGSLGQFDTALAPGAWTVLAAAMDTRGHLLVVGRDQERCHVTVWDLQARRLLRDRTTTLPLGNAIAATADGRVLVATSTGTLAVFAPDTDAEPAVLAAHTAAVTAIDIAPDGARFVTGCAWDDTLRIWDLQRMESLVLLPTPEYGAFSVHVSPDGRGVYTGSQDGPILRWNAARAPETALAADAARRHLARRTDAQLLLLRRRCIVLPDDVRGALAADTGLAAPVRDAVLSRLQLEGDDHETWQQTAWAFAVEADASDELRQRVLRTAVAAAGRSGLPEYRLTLAAAQLRAGQAAAAISTLTGLGADDPQRSNETAACWHALMALACAATGDPVRAEAMAAATHELALKLNRRQMHGAGAVRLDEEVRRVVGR
jgi:WD40 repeat protein